MLPGITVSRLNEFNVLKRWGNRYTTVSRPWQIRFDCFVCFKRRSGNRPYLFVVDKKIPLVRTPERRVFQAVDCLFKLPVDFMGRWRDLDAWTPWFSRKPAFKTCPKPRSWSFNYIFFRGFYSTKNLPCIFNICLLNSRWKIGAIVITCRSIIYHTLAIHYLLVQFSFGHLRCKVVCKIRMHLKWKFIARLKY